MGDIVFTMTLLDCTLRQLSDDLYRAEERVRRAEFNLKHAEEDVAHCKEISRQHLEMKADMESRGLKYPVSHLAQALGEG